MIPTDTSQGYKQMKAKIGRSRVRPWKWMPFTNPARKVSKDASFISSGYVLIYNNVVIRVHTGL